MGIQFFKMDVEGSEEIQSLLEKLSKVQLLSILIACAEMNSESREFIMSSAKQRRCHRRIYVRNLSFVTDDESLKNKFSQFGEVEEAAVVYKDGKSRGFGFITFVDACSAETACEASIIKLDGRDVSVRMASGSFSASTVTSPGQAEEIVVGCPRKVFVRNLSYSATDEDLRDATKSCGEVEECVVITSYSGVKRGFGFVTFKHPSSALKCLEEPQRVVAGRLAFFHPAVQEDHHLHANDSHDAGKEDSRKGLADASKGSCAEVKPSNPRDKPTTKTASSQNKKNNNVINMNTALTATTPTAIIKKQSKNIHIANSAHDPPNEDKSRGNHNDLNDASRVANYNNSKKNTNNNSSNQSLDVRVSPPFLSVASPCLPLSAPPDAAPSLFDRESQSRGGAASKQYQTMSDRGDVAHHAHGHVSPSFSHGHESPAMFAGGQYSQSHHHSPSFSANDAIVIQNRTNLHDFAEASYSGFMQQDDSVFVLPPSYQERDMTGGAFLMASTLESSQHESEQSRLSHRYLTAQQEQQRIVNIFHPNIHPNNDFFNNTQSMFGQPHERENVNQRLNNSNMMTFLDEHLNDENTPYRRISLSQSGNQNNTRLFNTNVSNHNNNINTNKYPLFEVFSSPSQQSQHNNNYAAYYPQQQQHQQPVYMTSDYLTSDYFHHSFNDLHHQRSNLNAVSPPIPFSSQQVVHEPHDKQYHPVADKSFFFDSQNHQQHFSNSRLSPTAEHKKSDTTATAPPASPVNSSSPIVKSQCDPAMNEV
eukprot:GDKJ01016484.1.p1 GENE.GDKJ01016484.1~~GDKJ01016484.1.p1  ORF type:complete len:762 (+),score=184.09 GDKJ01016484.1:2-2287(+)